MPRKRIQLDENIICKEYTDTNIGIESLATKYHVGKLRIQEILKAHNIPFKKKGAQAAKETLVVDDYRTHKYVNGDGYYYKVIDEKNPDFSTVDIYNLAGCLTSYIKKHYKICIPTLYERRMYYMRTGNYWWEQWLKYIRIKDEKIKKCPFCEWTTTDIDNKSGAFEQHLCKCHHISKEKYIEMFPNDRQYFALVSPYLNLRLLETDPNNFVTCKICGEKMARMSASHLKRHNMTRDEYIEKFGSDGLVCKRFHDRMHDISVEVNSNMKYHKVSSKENEITNYIKSLGFHVEQNRNILKGKELDIYIPDKMVAFEYDGLYWHNELYKSPNYHLQKTNDCKEHGIKLIHIFEDEWLHKSDIVKSRISSILGITDKRIFARKCDVVTLPSSLYEDFMKKNHIQGSARAKYKYGLLYQGELVCVMSFSGLRRNLGSKFTEGEYELLRYCNSLNTMVVGGASRLLKRFIKEHKPKRIVSYADRRWSDGNLYYKLGFTLLRYSEPNYFYVLNGVRYNRFTFRKDVLVSQGYDASLSEHKIMLQRKIYRIYDCGCMVFEMLPSYDNPNDKKGEG